MDTVLPRIMRQWKAQKKTLVSEKLRMVSMWLEGKSLRNIARHTGRSSATVYRWISRWRAEGHVNSRRRRGRPPKTTQEENLANDHNYHNLVSSLIKSHIAMSLINGNLNPPGVEMYAIDEFNFLHCSDIKNVRTYVSVY